MYSQPLVAVCYVYIDIDSQRLLTFVYIHDDFAHKSIAPVDGVPQGYLNAMRAV